MSLVHVLALPQRQNGGKMAQVHDAQIKHFPHAPSSSFVSLIFFSRILTDFLSDPKSFCHRDFSEVKPSVISSTIVRRILRPV